MFVLLGAFCLFSNANCTSVMVIGHPYPTKEVCMVVKRRIDASVGPVEWLDGHFECVQDGSV